MKSPSRKFTLAFFIYLVLLSIVILKESEIRAALDLPKVNTRIDDPDSLLLDVVLQPNDFSNEFTWYSVLITQSINNKTKHEEGATSILSGFWGRDKIGVINQIIISEQAFTRYDQTGLSTAFALPNVNLVPVSSNQKSVCSAYNDETVCNVYIHHSDIFISLEIILEKTVDTTTMENIVNPLLTILKNSLTQL